MYSEPSKLGYDTTMRRVDVPVQGRDKVPSTQTPDHDQAKDAVAQYDIAVRSSDSGRLTWYRTERLISNIGADAVQGNGSRVWQVRRVGKDGKPTGEIRVLKDCWVGHHRKREGAILAEIRASARTDAQKKAFEKYLLTVECHGDVYIDQELDNTHSLLRRGQAIPSSLGWHHLKMERPNEYCYLLPLSGTPRNRRLVKFISYDIASHYRIVFKECGITINSLNSAVQIFRSFSLALEGASYAAGLRMFAEIFV